MGNLFKEVQLENYLMSDYSAYLNSANPNGWKSY